MFWESHYAEEPALSGLTRVPGNDAEEWIQARMPCTGGKIAWSQVTEGHAHWHDDNPERLTRLVTALLRDLLATTPVVHIGESLSPWGVLIAADKADESLPALLGIPEHHYFLAQDRSWLVVVTTEGDVDRVTFG